VWPVERHPWIPTYGLTLVYIGCGVILLAMLSMRIPERRPVGAVAALGAYSYSIYLWHLAVKHWIVAQLVHLPVQSWFIYACVYFGGAVVVGVGMARLIEYPVLRLRDRVFPSISDAVERGPKRSRTVDVPAPSTAGA